MRIRRGIFERLGALGRRARQLAGLPQDNGGYRIIKQRLPACHGDRHFVGLDVADPPVDFTALACSLGLEAIRITRPDELDQLAPASGGPGRGDRR